MTYQLRVKSVSAIVTLGRAHRAGGRSESANPCARRQRFLYAYRHPGSRVPLPRMRAQPLF